LVLLDTHSWAWVLTGDRELPLAAQQAMDNSDAWMLSAVSFYEIAHKFRLGKWPEMGRFLDSLPTLAQRQAVTVWPVSGELALEAGKLNWSHRDPFDRLIAATALLNGWPLISADPAFDSLIGLRRIW
jgi:PIN domain nuclease of toxin-antitoxin system